MRQFLFGRTLAAILTMGLLAACGGGSGSSSGGGTDTIDTGEGELTTLSTPESELGPVAFQDCDELKAYYSEALAQEILTQYRYGFCYGCEPGTPAPVAQPVPAQDEDTGNTAAPAAGGSRDVTQTNTQETGVDEADLIETNPNGTEIYVLQRYPAELLAIDTADPQHLSILSRTRLQGDRQPRGMFFDPETRRLAVILEQAYDYLYYAGSGAPPMAVEDAVLAPPPFAQGTEVEFFDVSDPAAPRQIETYVTDGYYIDARRIGSRLHLVTQFSFPYPESLYQNQDFQQVAWQDYPRAYQDGEETEPARLESLIRQYIDEAVAAMPVDQLLPAESTQAVGSARLACSSIEHPAVPTRLGLILISSIGMDGGALSTLGSIDNSWLVYASTDNLYLVQSSGGWWFDPAQKQQSAIYRYDLSSGSAVPGAGVGLVDGWIDSSYQLSEWQGHLRVVSSEGRYAGPNAAFTRHHHLTVLDTAGMSETGAVRDFVADKQETIRSTRFAGDNGYVVSFRQVDPLFTFDLSDPAAPRQVGEVDIPGFSSYMHPLGDTHLLTIGRNAGDSGTGLGRSYQLQIFDVSDLADPQVIASASPALADDAYAYSLAEYDPHAFTYSTAAGLLSIPVQVSAADSADALSGFIAYRVDPAQGSNAISEYARIDHKDPPDGSNSGSGCPTTADELPPEPCGSFAPVIYNEPLRSAIIVESAAPPLPDAASTTLLTLSSAKLKALDASGDTARELDTLRLDQ